VRFPTKTTTSEGEHGAIDNLLSNTVRGDASCLERLSTVCASSVAASVGVGSSGVGAGGGRSLARPN